MSNHQCLPPHPPIPTEQPLPINLIVAVIAATAAAIVTLCKSTQDHNPTQGR